MIQLILIILSILIVSCSGDKVEVIENELISNADTGYIENKTLTFSRVPFIDTIVTQEEFLNLLIPEGYMIHSNLQWKTTDYTDPLKFAITLMDTVEFNMLYFHPSLTFITKTSSLPLQTRSVRIEKDTVYESSNMPRNAIDALVDYVLPIYIESSGNARIMLKKPLYNIHQTGIDGKEINAETACIHIEYTENNTPYEHVIYATLEKHYLQVESYNSTCEWKIKNIVSVKSVKGFLNNNMAIFQTIINSARLSPSWAYYYTFICSNDFRTKKNVTLYDYSHRFKTCPSIAEAQELSEYHRYQNVLRKTFAAYSMYMNHLEYYVDKDGMNVALPEGFTAVWSSTSSKLVITNVPNFKPLFSDLVAWVQIRKNESQSTYHYLEGSSAPEAGDPLFENPLYH